MAQLVLLIRAEHDEVSLGTRSIEALARLGVTSVSLVRGERFAAVILERWGFDPCRHAEAVAVRCA